MNHFLDHNKKLCITGDNCLANKFLFPKLYKQYFNHQKYLPKTYSFSKNNIGHLQLLKYSNNAYILKPENDYARGGISLISKYNDIIKWISNNRKYNKWVLQEYITNPILIEGKKFHFRTYILILFRKSNKNCETYLFNKYFALASPHLYNSKSNDTKIHFTGAKYCNVKLVTGKLMYDNKINFHAIEPQLKEIAGNCGKLVKKHFNVMYPHQTNYHLFACDIICDTNYNCHLLEVNNGGIGMEMPELVSKMCPNGGTLHDKNTIIQLFQNIIDVVLQINNSNNGFIKINMDSNDTSGSNKIEHFTNNYQNNCKYILILLVILLIISILFILFTYVY